MTEMQELLDYIEKYGTLSFLDKPFNEIDGLIFSQLAYIGFEGIVSDRSVFLRDAAIKYYTLYSDEEIEALIGISSKAAKLLTECAKTRRFGWVELSHYVNNVNDAIDKQFCGINFILSDDSLLVAFRGTDVTVTGLKESAMLSYMFPVPAQIEALHYFQETAMLSHGDIRICGHSKGGNLACFAAVNCSNSLKKRLVEVYEYDAPGFPSWFFERHDYTQIADKIRHYSPQGSVIGRMLYHDTKPIVVFSNSSGIKQHQVSSWIINDDKFQPVEKYDHMSDFVSEYINDLIGYVGEEDLELFFDTIELVLQKMGIVDFYDMKSLDIKKVYGIIDTHTSLDDVQKERFKQIIKKVFADFTKEFFSEKAKGYLDRLKTELPAKKEPN